MESKTVGEIVKIDPSDYSAKTITEAFLYTQKVWYGNEINGRQKDNVFKLAQLLYHPTKTDVNVPIIANVPMGEGKSCLLVEFMKFMHDNDPEFGAIVVKKTLKECHDFCIDMGIYDKYAEEYLYDNDRDTIKKMYYHYIDNNKKTETEENDYINGHTGFIARTVRGFNFTDCQKYKDLSQLWYFGRPPSDYVNYDYRLCHGCRIPCSARKSKYECSKHRILAITHTRLFLSNYIEEFFEDIMFFEKDGQKVKRRLLIIDEKIDMCDVSGITETNFKKIYEIIIDKHSKYEPLFKEIKQYFESLDYPTDMNEPIIKQDRFFRDGKGFSFDQDLLDAFYNDTTIEREKYEDLLTIEKILNSIQLTTNIPWRFGDSKKRAEREGRHLTREVCEYQYLDLLSYNQDFDKTLILDATAHLDYDYLKANAVICNEIHNEKRTINVFTPRKDANTSKSKILRTSDKSLNSEGRKATYKANVRNLVLECKSIMETELKKTLIVVYKEMTADRIYEFKEDFVDELKNECENMDYVVVHHGEFTTGVNDFSECDRLIIIGQLNKSSTFYENKCLAVGRTIGGDESRIQNVSQTEINDYLISNIQQIGRTAFRKKEDVDVYLIGRNVLNDMLLSEMGKYFDINLSRFDNIYYYQDPTKQELLIEKIKSENTFTKAGEVVKYEVFKKYCEEIGMDDSILRNKRFKVKLKELGIIKNPENNREYLFTEYM